MRRRFSLLVLALGCSAAPAAAQSETELEAARRKFHDALAQAAGGDWAGALARFEAVAKVKLTLQVRYHIARCKEHLGRLTEALGDYRLAEHEAERTRATELDEIRRARTEVERRIPSVRFDFGAGTEDARLVLDGVKLSDLARTDPLSLDPGRHRLIVEVPGRPGWEQRFELREGERLELLVQAPDEAEAAPSVPVRDPSESQASAAPELDTTTPELEGLRRVPMASWILGGTGALALMGAGVFYGLRNSAESDLDAGCRGDLCPDSLAARKDDSDRWARFTAVSLGVGAGALAAATLLYFVAPRREPPREATTRWRWDAQLERDRAFVGVQGAF